MSEPEKEIYSLPAKVKLKETIPAHRFEVDPNLNNEDKRQVQLLEKRGVPPNVAEYFVFNWKKSGSTFLPVAEETEIKAGTIVNVFSGYTVPGWADALMRVETDNWIVGTTLLSKTEPVE